MAGIHNELQRLHKAEVKAQEELTAAEAEAKAAGEELAAAGVELAAAREAFTRAKERCEAANTRVFETSKDQLQKLFAMFSANHEHTEFARKFYEHNKPGKASRN